MIYWDKKEFDTQGNLIKIISLNEKGEPDGVTKYYPSKNNLYEANKYNLYDLNYHHEYFYTLNENGHWINRVRVDDGVPRFICDRVIEYY